MSHFRLPRSFTDREQLLLGLCRGRTVLHLGCADSPFTDQSLASGMWLHSKISAVAASCLGVDLDGETIQRLKRDHGVTNIVEGDAERLNEYVDRQFEVIVAGEIIEHLNNPGLFLASAKRVLAPGGTLVITTTNAFCFRRMIRIPFGVESVHPDHTYYFSHSTLRSLTSRFGYALTDAYGYRIRNKKPLIPYLVESLATTVCGNWGEGIIHVYTPVSAT